jgi:hypothetical protein
MGNKGVNVLGEGYVMFNFRPKVDSIIVNDDPWSERKPTVL